MPISDPISKTARWIAAARATESRRADRLFEDRFAAHLAGNEGFELMRKMASAAQAPGSATVPENPYLPIRTRFIDDFVLGASANPALRQIVLVAAGVDARAFRLPFSSGTRVFELDRAEVLNFKEKTLSEIGAHPACERVLVPVDLRMSFRGELTCSGFDPAPWQFATDRPEEFFAASGWRATAKRPGEDGATYGRWPYPAPPPRGTPGLPQVFLVTAMRDGSTPVGA